MAENGKKVEREVERLTEPDWLQDVESGEGDRRSSVRAKISNAMVGLMKNFYGKGPTKAKTFLNDTYIFCVMEGGLTRTRSSWPRSIRVSSLRVRPPSMTQKM